MDARTRVAWNLRRLRTARDMTQEALAVDAQIDRTWVSGIERTESNPTVEILERIATAMDVDISEFFVRVDPRSEPPKGLKAGRKPNK